MTSKRVVARPTPEQFERWSEAKGDLSWTELISQAVEGWLKPFGPEEVGITDDNTAAGLREHRNQLLDELQQAHDHITDLRQQLDDSEAREIDRYVAENPEADFEDVVAHVQATARSRVAEHMDLVNLIAQEKRQGALREAQIEAARAADERIAIEEKGIERVVAEDYPDDVDIDDAYPEHELEDYY